MVATAIYGLTDAVIDGVTGTLIPPRNTDAIYEAVSTLLAQPELGVSFGKEGRMRVLKDFEQEVVVMRYVDFVSKLLER